jgi:hypothetical protein
MRRWSLMVALVALGCQEFQDPSTVIDLRLLAAQLDPPEVIQDPAASAAVAVTFTPLLLDPRGEGRAVAYTLRACANDPTAPSAPGAGAQASGNYPAGGARSSVGSARCPADGPTSWTLPVEPPLGAPGAARIPVTLTSEQITAAFAADVFLGHLKQAHGGFDLGLPIDFELTATAGGESVVGLKRLVIWPAPLSPEHRANQNPMVTEVLAYADRDPVSTLPRGPVTVVGADPLVVRAGARVWLEPRGALAEPYLTTIVDRLTDKTTTVAVPAETLRHSFYATAGKFDPHESSTALPFGSVPTDRIPTEARYEAPAASNLPVDPVTGARRLAVRVLVVTRDERGGAGWVERAILVEE